MPTSDQIRHRGSRDASRLARQVGYELRHARVAAGVSQRQLAQTAGLSQSRVSRIERARDAPEWLEDLSIQCAALGLRLSVKVYPSGSPVRDAGQLRLLGRFRMQLDQVWGWRSELPIGGYGDLRAWDVRLDGPGSIGVDAETRLHDIQALQRRCEGKLRDSSVDRVVLLVARTRHNLAILRDHRDALSSTFPSDTREVMAALRTGSMPARSGLVVL